MAYTGKNFVVNTGIHTVGNTFVANTSTILFNTNVTFTNTTVLIANGVAGTADQVLAANSSGQLYWKTLPPAVNTLFNYSFANTVTFNGTVVFANAISTNASYGTAGEVFAYNGSNSYWATPILSVTGTGALTNAGTSNITLDMNTVSANQAGQYGLPAITVDTYGRITSITTVGAGGVQTINSANQQVVTVTGTSGNGSTGFYGNITLNLANLYAIGTTTTISGGSITVDAYGRITGGTSAFSSNVSFSNNYIIASSFKATSEFISNVTTTSATTTLDLSTSNFFNISVDRNTNLIFSNQPTGRVSSFTVIIKQDTTGGWTIGLPASCKYPNKQTPVKTTAANAIDLWTFTTYDGGTTYIASLTMKDVK